MATQMEAAKRGEITEAMQVVARKENLSAEEIRARVAAGTVVIPKNQHHHSIDPEGVGQGLKTKINVNLGISKDCANMDNELDKVRKALEMKAEAIMDLSNYGKTALFREKLIEMSPAMIGTVPMYDAIGYLGKKLEDITPQEFLAVVEKHAQDGVDFMTIHAGLNRQTVEHFKRTSRVTNIVSRGGSLLYAWMELNQAENPFYEYFDEVLNICAEHDVTLSLGDACRPGSITDATDASQVEELIVLGELTQRAWDRNVQVMIEGAGHMALNEIQANVLLEKKLCHGAPFYVLGPLVTDVAPGYDHITSAIGGAIAGAAGADFLCYVTPAEHLRLPTQEDMREGIIAAKIAAHAADLAKGVPGAAEWDRAMSTARQALDWPKMFDLAIDSEKAERYRRESSPTLDDSCTMCGEMCSMRLMNKFVTKKK
ncbi:phosphomethylpyrimidine synthase ThiC [Desulfitobacterium sp.]|uniref:phosphomethylpyrimidine synthase ThiC n=1 Tax=Desulfitobacterium sp. TaxID=49981 RepID=UPI002C427EB2|nr:phosphomethylpyrimidine synthase ThiC [Desulfitobacterium sp.]HVJ50087.1 phosphomethylpyrimidine synthase ThiC [Desulfitobacterium sp.]